MFVYFFTTISLLILIASAGFNLSDGVNGQQIVSNANSKCLEAARRFPAFPGGGWDNLRNLDMGLVARLSYDNCKLSNDGRYLLPRDIILYPRKESKIEVYSELMGNFSDYTDSVSRTINTVGSGVSKKLGVIGGRLSDEYRHVQDISLRGNNATSIGRTQLIYRTYSVKLQPDFQLSESLTSRLKNVVKAQVEKRLSLSRYRADLIIRDFGTHVVTSIDAGGILEKLDFIRSDFVNNDNFQKNKLSASMGLAFHSLLGVNISGGATVSKEDMRDFEKNISNTIVKSIGGPNLGSKPNLDDWLKKLNDNLVPVDRNGELLCDVISERSLPGVNGPQLLDLRKEIQSAIERYYQANTIVGCMDPGSKDFDPLANFPGDCEHQAKNYSFAGIYQTCDEDNPEAKFNLCSDKSGSSAVRNPITGKFDCPVEYDAIPLFKIVGKTAKRCEKKTKRCWLIFKCEDGEECVQSRSTLEAFWCAAGQGEVLPAHSGMVYGGAYASDGRFVNEITKTTACSESFKPYQIGRDIFLCLSLDLDESSGRRIPFGGFFSCNNGNPLAKPGREPVAKRVKGVHNDHTGPQKCPTGFSQVTLDIIDGCAVMQCVKSRPDHGTVPIRVPPFEDAEFEELHPSNEDEGDQGESSRIAGGVVGGVLGAVGLGGAVAYLSRRRSGADSGSGGDHSNRDGSDSQGGAEDRSGGIVRRLRGHLARRFGGRRTQDIAQRGDPEAGGCCNETMEHDDSLEENRRLVDNIAEAGNAASSTDQDATLQVRIMQAIRPR